MQASMDIVRPYSRPQSSSGQSIGEFQLIRAKGSLNMYSNPSGLRAISTTGNILDAMGSGHVRQVRKDCAGVILYIPEKATWMAGEAIADRSAANGSDQNDYPTAASWRETQNCMNWRKVQRDTRMLIVSENSQRDP